MGSYSVSIEGNTHRCQGGAVLHGGHGSRNLNIYGQAYLCQQPCQGCVKVEVFSIPVPTSQRKLTAMSASLARELSTEVVSKVLIKSCWGRARRCAMSSLKRREISSAGPSAGSFRCTLARSMKGTLWSRGILSSSAITEQARGAAKSSITSMVPAWRTPPSKECVISLTRGVSSLTERGVKTCESKR